MEQTNYVKNDPRFENLTTSNPGQSNVWAPSRIRETDPNIRKPMEYVLPDEYHQSKGRIHACKASQRGYQQARDRLRRAERDLGETAAFIAASLTTVTAIQAVISIARDKLELSKEVLQLAFQGYILVFILIFLLGALRIRSAIRRRSQAEKEIDQTKKGIFEFCPTDQWPKSEE